MTFINWSALKNPVYSRRWWSVKDAAMVYHDSQFYLFFSAFYWDRFKIRSHVVEVSTKDWHTFSSPILHIDGREDGWTGLCSPDVSKIGDHYYLVYNSWGAKHPNGKHNWLFYQSSKDLCQWSKAKPVGVNLNEDHRVIDISICHDNSKFYVIWKDEKYDAGGKKDYKTRMGTCQSLEESLAYIGDGYPKFYLANGQESQDIHENYQFIQIDGQWHVLTTDYPNHRPILYQMQGNPAQDESWLQWTNGHELVVPQEEFNRHQTANAAFLADWRAYDGFFYLLYAGRTHDWSFKGRGDNKLGLVRSKDLKTWKIPPT